MAYFLGTPSPWECAFLGTSESAFESPGMSVGPGQATGAAQGDLGSQGLRRSLQGRELH